MDTNILNYVYKTKSEKHGEMDIYYVCIE